MRVTKLVMGTCWGEDRLRVVLGIRHALVLASGGGGQEATLPVTAKGGLPACREEQLTRGIPGLIPSSCVGVEEPPSGSQSEHYMVSGPHTELGLVKSPRIFGPQFPDVRRTRTHPRMLRGSRGVGQSHN